MNTDTSFLSTAVLTTPLPVPHQHKLSFYISTDNSPPSPTSTQAFFLHQYWQLPSQSHINTDTSFLSTAVLTTPLPVPHQHKLSFYISPDNSPPSPTSTLTQAFFLHQYWQLLSQSHINTSFLSTSVLTTPLPVPHQHWHKLSFYISTDNSPPSPTSTLTQAFFLQQYWQLPSQSHINTDTSFLSTAVLTTPLPVPHQHWHKLSFYISTDNSPPSPTSTQAFFLHQYWQLPSQSHMNTDTSFLSTAVLTTPLPVPHQHKLSFYISTDNSPPSPTWTLTQAFFPQQYWQLPSQSHINTSFLSTSVLTTPLPVPHEHWHKLSFYSSTDNSPPSPTSTQAFFLHQSWQLPSQSHINTDTSFLSTSVLTAPLPVPHQHKLSFYISTDNSPPSPTSTLTQAFFLHQYWQLPSQSHINTDTSFLSTAVLTTPLPVPHQHWHKLSFYSSTDNSPPSPTSTLTQAFFLHQYWQLLSQSHINTDIIIIKVFIATIKVQLQALFPHKYRQLLPVHINTGTSWLLMILFKLPTVYLHMYRSTS